MNPQLFFLYDSHCPWSYAATPLVNTIIESFPDIALHTWHVAYFQGDQTINKNQISEISKTANVSFSEQYLAQLTKNKDSVLVANLMAWVSQKSSHNVLPILNALQKEHFVNGNELIQKEQLMAIIEQFKISPPAKALKNDKLSKEAEFVFQDAYELLEIIGTQAIPALLLAVNNDLVLLNHNLYLDNPKHIIDAVTIELSKHQ